MGCSGLSAAVTNNARPTTRDQQREGSLNQLPQLAVEIWPCGHIARCSMPECLQQATTILRYLDNRERFHFQREACDVHTNPLCAGLKIIERGQHPEA